MKRLLTLLALLPLASFTYGQAITITAADVPLPTAPYVLYNVNPSAVPNPTPGASLTWDYSTYTGPTDTVEYTVETDPFFTSAGSNLQIMQLKHFSATMVYKYSSKIDFNPTGIYENGIDIPAQGYDISAISGTPGDSLNIPAQRYMQPTPKKIISYPATAASSWSSNSHWATNFILTVSAAGIDHVPSTHKYIAYRKDTITAWGKMRVYTASGPSIEYNVLMDKVTDYVVDSFFLGGSPAPAALLSGFGVSQGQKTEEAYRYMFLIKGSFMYLASLVYMQDATYTTPVSMFVNKAATPAGVNDVAGSRYTTVLFPNPAVGNEINMLISGANLHADSYHITDMLGRVVQSGAANMQHDVVHIPFDNALPKGQYTLTVNGAGAKIASENFNITR